MKDIFDCYLELKKSNPDKFYLFESSDRYSFLGEDCEYVSSLIPLDKRVFNDEINECGFDKKLLRKYITIFKKIGLDVEIVFVDEPNRDDMINSLLLKIASLDIENITPVDTLVYLSSLKELL